MANVTLTPGLALAYSAVPILAVVPIWIGSHRHLLKNDVETMNRSDAMFFPLLGSCVLFGLYLLFHYFSKEYVNLILTSYFLFFGIGAIHATISPWLHFLLSPLFTRTTTERKKSKKGKNNDNSNSNSKENTNNKLKTYHITVPFTSIKRSFNGVDVVSLVGAITLVAWYAYTKYWVTNNLIGLAFSIQAIAMLSLGSFQVGAILLIGLFFYDIFWVFGTEVMVSVAKSFDAPVKLLFPKDIFDPNSPFSMLGLGDIVIPGIFISLLLKFDGFRAMNKHSKKKNKGKELLQTGSFSKPYFYTNFIFYIIGLITTIVVMHCFQAAQPALLYLVPACLGAAIGTAVVRGELSQLFSYSEEPKPNANANNNNNNTTTTTTTNANSNTNPKTNPPHNLNPRTESATKKAAAEPTINNPSSKKTGANLPKQPAKSKKQKNNNKTNARTDSDKSHANPRKS